MAEDRRKKDRKKKKKEQESAEAISGLTKYLSVDDRIEVHENNGTFQFDIDE